MSTPINLAINAVPLAPGGGLTGLLGYIEAWEELNTPLEITVFASKQGVINALNKTRRDIKVVPFALASQNWKHFFLQQTKLGKLINKGSFDAVLTTQYGIRNCNVPQIVHHRNLKRFLYPELGMQIQRKAWSEAVKDYVARKSLITCFSNIFISHFMKEAAENIVPKSKNKNIVIHNGLTQKQLLATFSANRETHNKTEIIAIQDTSLHKDNPTLILALKELLNLRPEIDWRLKIAGGGNWQTIGSLAYSAGVLSRVQFCGFLEQDELSRQLSNALCLVFTSKLEGFGNPPLEAMANGCPVIACNCSAMPEVIGDAGILVEPGKFTEFAQSILKFHDDPFLRENYVQKGINRIQNFSWQSSAQKMYKVICQAVADNQDYNSTKQKEF